MKSSKSTNIRNVVIASGLALASHAALAATFTSSFNSTIVGSLVTGSGASTFAADTNKVQVAAASGTTAALNIVKATAWANTYTTGAATANEYNFEKATLTPQGSGLGITTVSVEGTNPAAPEHAIDNAGAREFVLFEFDQAVTLNALQLSYISGDSDLSILAFTGAGDAEALLHGAASGAANPANGLDSTATGNNLAGSNWKSLNISNATANTGFGFFETAGAGGTAVASKFWAVGAYNTGLGGGISTAYSDYVKLAGLGGSYTTPCTGPGCTPPGGGVPEPSSLTLAALGLLGGIRRWKNRKST